MHFEVKCRDCAGFTFRTCAGVMNACVYILACKLASECVQCVCGPWLSTHMGPTQVHSGWDG